jgi:hypothetical protein
MHDMRKVPDFSTVADVMRFFYDAGMVGKEAMTTGYRNILSLSLERPLAGIEYL